MNDKRARRAKRRQRQRSTRRSPGPGGRPRAGVRLVAWAIVAVMVLAVLVPFLLVVTR